MLAALTAQADIRTEADDGPVGAAAGVRLAQTHHVANVDFDEPGRAHVLDFRRASARGSCSARGIDGRAYAFGFGSRGGLPVGPLAGVEQTSADVDDRATAGSVDGRAHGPLEVT